MTILYQEKGFGLFEYLESVGYRLAQESGVWVVDVRQPNQTWVRDESGSSHAMVNAYIDAYVPPVEQRLVSQLEFLRRFNFDHQARIYAAGQVDPKIGVRLAMLFGQDLVNLTEPLLLETLDYLETQGDASGPLLTAEQRAALLA